MDTVALVLSGGGGERLSVLTAERAVSAVPFGGKYRIIDFALSNCCHSGVAEVGLVTQHAPTSLHDHVGSGRPWDLDRRAGGVLMLQPYQTRSHAGWYRGTADALAQNGGLIDERRPDRVLVLSGDHIYRMDYRTLVQTARRTVESTSFVLLESLAEAVATALYQLEPVFQVTATVHKPGAARSQGVGDVSAEVTISE